MEIPLSLIINGEKHKQKVPANLTLLELLREEMGLLGTKQGCNSGTCGSCTVIIDGEPALSCLTLAVSCQGKSVTTVEGLSQGEGLHPLQAAAIEHDAVQCGFCTPGWLLSAKVLLDHNPNPSLREVQEAVAGNLCRCTGYKQIEQAILAAAKDNMPK